MPTSIDLNQIPAAQGSNGQSTSDAGSSQPPSGGSGSPPAAAGGDDAAERQRRAAEGRRTKDLQQKIDGLTSLVVQQQQTLAALGASMNEQEQQRQQAYLESLPPEQRLEELIKLQTKRIDAMQSQTTRPVAVQPAESDVAYQNRRMQEILDEANELYPGANITAEERDALVERGALDISSEEAYARSLKQIAHLATRGNPPQQGDVGQQGGTMPQGTNQQQPLTEDEVERRAQLRAQEIADQQLRALGIHRPNAASAASTTGPATSETYQGIARSFNSRIPPKQRIAQLQKARDRR